MYYSCASLEVYSVYYSCASLEVYFVCVLQLCFSGGVLCVLVVLFWRYTMGTTTAHPLVGMLVGTGYIGHFDGDISLFCIYAPVFEC